ncbi:DNA topoisomerase III [Aggregatibacter actinomycetemcomitans]|uniref:DNA topoisomerase III n=1 Tax=Aggregatibacter actinomycetemcomitans TaxID=714 RepID=UPI00197C867F|nr:DNA topoisomerase III [Aggregatibacter actinomycetemcomitans]MBN6058651.1 DNA topoisomerase III [Aggregatibacter actinomycetemcomitans]MBN6087160.1 DNA topoisomerase III [Aggregatibacter actinomycetemcomitans]
MKLFLCEKAFQGNDIARILGANQRGDGYLSTPDGQTFVTWGIGHLVEPSSPEEYHPEWKKWSLETLPIIPKQWQLIPIPQKKKQYKIVIKLIQKAQSIVISTDIDREGETIARELLDLAGFRGPIQRLWLSALDDASIRKALNALKANHETLPLYYAGLGRSRADWLIGMNFSRLFTLLAQQQGYQGKPFSVGRVQSPTLALVVNRDREIRNFTPKTYFTLSALLSSGKQDFSAQYVIPENLCDEDGLCLSQQVIQSVNQQVQQTGIMKVESVEIKREKQSAPLLYALSDLQSEANRLYGLGAQQVLDIAQALYETHKATTYPRTDCGYLPESQLAEASLVIKNLMLSDSRLQPLTSQLNLTQKSRVWNDKKITAHHGIIPTAVKVDIRKMSEEEFKLYDLIRRRYLAQFLPISESDKTQILLKCGSHTFISEGNVMIVPGWKILFGKTLEESNENQQILPALTNGQQCKVLNAEMKSLQTSPPAHYTEGTLLTAMKNAARFVVNEDLKKRLRETEGLGTEATRAGLIQGLINKGFLNKKGKSLIASTEAFTLIDNLPVVLKDPGLTALWEQALNQIAEGSLTLDSFMQKQEAFLRHLLNDCMTKGISLGKIEIRKCPQCGASMAKRNGKNGQFWGCTAYPDCNHIENIKITQSRRHKRGGATPNVSKQIAALRQIVK